MIILRLGIVLAAVGVFFSSQLSAQDAKTNEATGDEEFRFVFYNVRNYLRQDRFIKGEMVRNIPKPADEKKAVVGTFARLRPAVIGLCEMGDMSDVDDFRDRLKSVGLEYPHVEWVEAADETRHLVLLSQFPIVSRDSQTNLTYSIGELELAHSRGILDATLQVNPSYQVRCVGLHLKSKREVPDVDQALMRRNEAHLARKHIETIFDADPEINLLVFGDFNDTRNEVAVKALSGKFGSPRYLSALKLEDFYGFEWTHHWDFADIYSRIDFILTSRGISREVNRDKSYIYHYTLKDDRKAWMKASDHRPLVTQIKPVDQKLR